jgi:predicted flap endonuclease-1-like 5' DNA nuclease
VTFGRGEADDHRADDDLPQIGAPATRALAGIGVTRLSQLTEHTEDELLALHGIGPRALRIIQDALNSRGLELRS